MNKLISAIAISMLMAGTLLTSCQTAQEKENDAQEDVQEAQQDLREAEAAQKNTDAEEWRVFKNEMELEIVKNENRIAELRVKLQKPGKALDKVYAERIDALEQKNKELKQRISDYDKNQSDWASFKREFKHDMDELGKALNDLVVDNKN